MGRGTWVIWRGLLKIDQSEIVNLKTGLKLMLQLKRRSNLFPTSSKLLVSLQRHNRSMNDKILDNILWCFPRADHQEFLWLFLDYYIFKWIQPRGFSIDRIKQSRKSRVSVCKSLPIEIANEFTWKFVILCNYVIFSPIQVFNIHPTETIWIEFRNVEVINRITEELKIWFLEQVFPWANQRSSIPSLWVSENLPHR